MQELDEKAERWVWWCRTRRYFAPHVQSNILARLQPRRGRLFEIDPVLDGDLSFFNMAVHALCETGDCEAECFLGVFWYQVRIKELARQFECSRGTVYNRARRFIERANTLARVIRGIHECSKIVEQNSAFSD